MMEIYRTIFDRIEKVELVKETAKRVVYKDDKGNEYREAKETSYTSIHKSFIDAKNYLISKHSKLVDKAEKRLKHEEDKLDAIQLL